LLDVLPGELDRLLAPDALRGRLTAERFLFSCAVLFLCAVGIGMCSRPALGLLGLLSFRIVFVTVVAGVEPGIGFRRIVRAKVLPIGYADISPHPVGPRAGRLCLLLLSVLLIFLVLIVFVICVICRFISNALVVAPSRALFVVT